MISVVIPYYNPENDSNLKQLLKRAISSALTAFGNEEEVQTIVVDDGSPFPPYDIIKDFDSSKIHLVETVHSGLGAARNRGIAESPGDIIAFLDADDMYVSCIPGKCVREMKRSGADLLSFNMIECVGDAVPRPYLRDISCSTPTSGREYMSHHTPFGSCCRFLISRHLLTCNNLKFAEGTFMEDEDFTPRLLFYSKRYVQCNATAYAYCRREGSITTSPSLYDKRAADTTNVLKRLIGFRQSQPSEYCDGINRKIRCIALDHIRLTLRRPDWKKALPVQTEILSSMGLWPLKPAPYGIRYMAFALLSQSDAGIMILRLNEKRYVK